MSDFKKRPTQIQITHDKKSSNLCITKIDSEGFSHVIFVTKRELNMLLIAAKYIDTDE